MSGPSVEYRERIAADGEREAERQRVIAFLRGRGAQAVKLARDPIFTRAEAERLKRWFEAAADDIAEGLHDPEEVEELCPERPEE